jgi:glycosyltransferase involved in cell wall biosynthesis
MIDRTKDKIFLCLLFIVCITLVVIVITACIAEDQKIEIVQPHNDIDNPEADIPLGLMTNDKHIILADPSCEISRIIRSGNTTPQEIRNGNMFKFKTESEINIQLDIILSRNRYSYQTDPWKTCYFWYIQNCKPRFAVIMPVFNQETIIQRSIESVFNCMQDDFEFIILIDGCTDATKSKIIAFMEESQLNRRSCCAIIVIEIKQSVFETQCDNIGFKISSAPNVIEIQADMTIIQPGFNLILEKPLLFFNDLIALSGRCAHNVDGTYSIGFPNEFADTSYTPWNYDNVIYLSSTVNRGPLLFDRKKLEEMGFLDDVNFSLGNDEHDLFSRAWKFRGYRTAYIHINFQTDMKDGSTRKPMSLEQKRILNIRRKNKNYTMGKLPEFLIPNFRILDYENFQKYPLQDVSQKIFGEKIKATLIQFGNTNSIHYHNATLTQMAHYHIKLNFQTVKLYTEYNVYKFLETLPSDVKNKHRGFYYWAWKPYIVLQTLQQAEENEIVIYSDSGLFFTNSEKVRNLCEQTEREGYVIFDILHNIQKYCKSDCLPYMNNPKNLQENMLDGSLFFLKNNSHSRFLVQEWLTLCQTPFLLSDESALKANVPNASFIDHRHDQTLWSIVLRNNAVKSVGCKHKQDIPFVAHHRTRTINDLKNLWTQFGINPLFNALLDTPSYQN